ncbi:hypothetical protein [Streptomyces flavofungini]|uniref:hypothetical protein n=1 Tax=Streptomyces flavofungini TaxID=68200 RepID=UPI0025B11226|nr:hypothetical protein [Streptomyces flavofungini]WJV51718.1 hypothetical protein QUY26_40375 [Streptomyces flavofungini]
MDAIVAFERAHAADHGRHQPAPGTEYDFSISDIGRAAVQLLGTPWHAESLPWGVSAHIGEEGKSGGGYLLAVDEDGGLYIADDARGGSRTELDGASAADGLPALAARVADIVTSLHTFLG